MRPEHREIPGAPVQPTEPPGQATDVFHTGSVWLRTDERCEQTHLVARAVQGEDHPERLHALSSLFDFSELETRLLMAAFSIHDLNKLYEPGGKGLRQVVDDRIFLEQVIQESGVRHFFPEWENYVVDLKQLILGHGTHSTVAGEQLYTRGSNRICEIAEVSGIRRSGA